MSQILEEIHVGANTYMSRLYSHPHESRKIFLVNDLSEVLKRGWREGVGRLTGPKIQPKLFPELCPPSPKGA